jgi:hypothetical protein
MACRQTRGLIALLLGSFFILASLGVRAQPANTPPGEKNAYQFRALTVQVRSAKADKPDETVEGGYGFVVARHGDVLTIVTADHVVRDQDGIVYGKVTVEPYVSRGHPLPAQVLDFQMPRDYGDMAVLEVHRSNFPALPPVPVAKLPIAEGTEAWRIGKEQGWTPSNRPGVFVGRQKTIWLGFDNLDAPRGSSGGPILTNDGLIGMVTDDQSGRGYVLPVDTIIDFLTSQGAPWDLADPRKAPTPPSPPTTGAPPSTTPPSTTATAAPPPTTTAPAADFAVSDYLGEWTNADPNTRGISRLSVRKDVARVVVQLWGNCHPNDCDWGTVQATPLARSVQSSAAAPITAINATYSPGFAEKRVTLRMAARNNLTATVDTHFTDNSGRADYESIDRFVPAPHGGRRRQCPISRGHGLR